VSWGFLLLIAGTIEPILSAIGTTWIGDNQYWKMSFKGKMVYKSPTLGAGDWGIFALIS